MRSLSIGRLPLLLLALLAFAAGFPPLGLARDGGDREVRVRGTCGRGAESSLRLRAQDGAIRVDFEVRTGHGGQRWRVAIVHERRIAWRGRARTLTDGSFRVRRAVPDFGGADQVTVRASGPRGNTCEATALLVGS